MQKLLPDLAEVKFQQRWNSPKFPERFHVIKLVAGPGSEKNVSFDGIIIWR